MGKILGIFWKISLKGRIQYQNQTIYTAYKERRCVNLYRVLTQVTTRFFYLLLLRYLWGLTVGRIRAAIADPLFTGAPNDLTIVFTVSAACSSSAAAVAAHPVMLTIHSVANVINKHFI